MTAKEVEDSITFEMFGTDEKTDSVLFRSIFTIEYFGRVSRSQDSPQARGAILRDCRERIMRKLYDDQREGLYAAIYDLRATDPLDYEERRKAENALLAAAMRQP